ncbi:PmbA/TldA family metallopeptidase, partial [Pyxidicoccus sp. 3LG]
MPRATASQRRAPSSQLAPPVARRAPVSSLLPQPLLERLLAVAMERGGDFAEVYVERMVSTAVVLEESRIKSAQTGLTQGVGVRVISGGKVGYAFSDDWDEPALLRAASTAAMIAQGGGSERSFPVRRAAVPSHYRVTTPLADVEVALKADLLTRADKAARGFDSRVKQVNATYADQTRRIAVANTEGRYTEDSQDLCKLSVVVVAQGKNGEQRSGMQGGGGSRVLQPLGHLPSGGRGARGGA